MSIASRAAAFDSSKGSGGPPKRNTGGSRNSTPAKKWGSPGAAGGGSSPSATPAKKWGSPGAGGNSPAGASAPAKKWGSPGAGGSSPSGAPAKKWGSPGAGGGSSPSGASAPAKKWGSPGAGGGGSPSGAPAKKWGSPGAGGGGSSPSGVPAKKWGSPGAGGGGSSPSSAPAKKWGSSGAGGGGSSPSGTPAKKWGSAGAGGGGSSPSGASAPANKWGSPRAGGGASASANQWGSPGARAGGSSPSGASAPAKKWGSPGAGGGNGARSPAKDPPSKKTPAPAKKWGGGAQKSSSKWPEVQPATGSHAPPPKPVNTASVAGKEMKVSTPKKAVSFNQAPSSNEDIDLAFVDDFLEELATVRVATNDQVVTKGETGTCMYIVAEGSVTVHLPSGDINLQKGSFFGEIALFLPEKRSVDVTAAEPTILYVLTKRVCDDTLRQYPRVKEQFIALAQARLEENQTGQKTSSGARASGWFKTIAQKALKKDPKKKYGKKRESGFFTKVMQQVKGDDASEDAPVEEDDTRPPEWTNRDSVLSGQRKRVGTLKHKKCASCRARAQEGTDFCESHQPSLAQGPATKEQDARTLAIRAKANTLDDTSWIRGGDVEIDPMMIQCGGILTFIRVRDRSAQRGVGREEQQVLKEMKKKETNICIVCTEVADGTAVRTAHGLVHVACFKCAQCDQLIGDFFLVDTVSGGVRTRNLCAGCHSLPTDDDDEGTVSEEARRVGEFADRVAQRLARLLEKGPPRAAPPAPPKKKSKWGKKAKPSTPEAPPVGRANDQSTGDQAAKELLKEYVAPSSSRHMTCGPNSVTMALLSCRKSTMRGWLQKRSQTALKGWSKRWCILVSGVFRYYKDDLFLADSEYKEHVLEPGKSRVVQKGNDFTIYTEGDEGGYVRTTQLRAANQKESTMWFTVLMEQCTPPIPSPKVLSGHEAYWQEERNPEDSSAPGIEVFDEEGKLAVLLTSRAKVVAVGNTLMGALMANENEPDHYLIEELLLTCRHAATSLSLLDQLKSIFFCHPVARPTAEDTEHFLKMQPVLQRRVLGVLRVWVDEYFSVDFDENEALSKNTVCFLGAAQGHATAYDIQMLCQDAFNRFRELVMKPKKRTIHFTHQVCVEPIGHLCDCDTNTIAEQLTYLDSKKFQAIRKVDFCVNLWSKDAAQKERMTKNIQAFIDRFNELSYWVATEICLTPNLAKRTAVMQKFIAIASATLKQGNFNTTFALVSGLNTSSVQRLKKTFEGLPKKSRKQLCVLEAAMDPTSNYGNYRAELRRRQRDGPVIPFFGLFIQDFTFTHDGNPRNLANGLVNMDKLTMISDLCLYWEQLQNRRHSVKPNPQLLQYLSNVGVLDEWIVYANSLLCEPRGNKEKERLIDKWMS